MNVEKEKCCGCGACVNVCPKKCIMMQPDKEGFIYPKVDITKCINCKLCEQVCPFLNLKKADTEPIVYAARSKEDQVRFHSSSGGIFPELAKEIFKNNGVVFGAVMSPDNRKVVFACASNCNELLPIQGSKYIQAEIGDTYLKIKDYLSEGKKVLFTGTTCQVAGLRSYLKKDYDNLICADVICHGVPSPLMWEKYCDYLKDKYHCDITQVFFRSKKYSWSEFGIKMIAKKEVFEFSFQNPYFRLFNSNLCLRPSCYDCKVKGLNNRSDISLGDFWHIEELIPSFEDGKGVSIILLNTQKGVDFFNKCMADEEIEVASEHVSYEQACVSNNAIYKSMSQSTQRTEFFDNLTTQDFLTIKNKYTQDSFNYCVKAFLIKSGIWKTLQKIRGGALTNDYGMLIVFQNIGEKRK